MTSEQLQNTLNQLGVIRYNGANVAPCKRCQPEETQPERFKLYVNPGQRLPVVLFCMRCSIPKPSTDEDKRHNKQVVYYNVMHSNIDPALYYTYAEPHDIRNTWASIGTIVAPQEPDRANDNVLNFCYRNLLSKLELNERHCKWLERKGLSVETCKSILYRSTPTQTQSRQYCKELHQSAGNAVCVNVPGLTTDRWLTRDNAIIIPCRDENGLIGALKQRLMSEGTGRMRLLSGNGPRAKQMIHWPLGSKLVTGKPLWITEGERKADVVYHLLGHSIIGVPGVGTLAQAMEPSIRAGAVVLAFDKDEAGLKATNAIGRSLLASGVHVEVAKWDSRFKKVDDAIANGAKIESVGVGSFGVDENRTRNYKIRPKQPTKYEVLAYIKQKGPVLRDSVKCHPALLSSLIREGCVVMTKTTNGQVVEAI